MRSGFSLLELGSLFIGLGHTEIMRGSAMGKYAGLQHFGDLTHLKRGLLERLVTGPVGVCSGDCNAFTGLRVALT